MSILSLLSVDGWIEVLSPDTAIVRIIPQSGDEDEDREDFLMMRNLRTLDEVTEEYFRDHPDEIDDYLMEIFQDFAEDNDTGALLTSLRILARVRGITDMAARIGMTRQGIQKALSDDGNPRLGNALNRGR